MLYLEGCVLYEGFEDSALEDFNLDLFIVGETHSSGGWTLHREKAIRLRFDSSIDTILEAVPECFGAEFCVRSLAWRNLGMAKSLPERETKK